MADLDKARELAREIISEDTWKSDDLDKRAKQVSDFRKLCAKSTLILAKNLLTIDAENAKLKEEVKALQLALHEQTKPISVQLNEEQMEKFVKGFGKPKGNVEP